jgi:hypothetical protein
LGEKSSRTPKDLTIDRQSDSPRLESTYSFSSEDEVDEVDGDDE